ncbi:uncharacterized protein LOC131242439 isoform X2 [Magnolia sinica]|uniref:uncharacterized protein LOC131242439 isoform X2 n=1 Tax=Magnolia sinica TaxID=86752 RepID=UPI00265A4732|nr:uncharacterized protein LOC131242439 isoform X2 [Magnolia sinica]
MESSVELSMLHRIFWPSKGYRLIQVLSCILLCLAMCGPCATRNHLVSCANGWWDSLDYDACRSYTDNDASLQDLLFGDVSSIYIQGNSPRLSAIKSVCTQSDLFCFPSTLPGFLAKEDDNGEAQNSNDSTSTEVSVLHNTRESNSSWNMDHATFTLSNGRLISCSLNSAWEPREKLPPLDNNFDQNGLDSCKGPSLPNVSMQKPTTSTSTLDKNPKAVASDLFNGSSSLHVSISPPLLDWGLNHLYVPSLAFLTVANTCNDTILHVYEPFSTDPQFYTYDFKEMSLAPGEASTIAFVFLPRWLGLSSSHLVLQTSSGGFVINAKGVAVESPYGIQPLVGLDISSDGRLRKNLSLYNPFDDGLFVEEIAAWIAVTTDNTSHYAHTVCSVDTSHASDRFSSSLNVKEWLNVKSETGLRLMGIRPYGQWEVGSHNTETIIEVDMLSHVEGKAFGAFCMQLRSSSCDRTDTVIVPLEAEVHGRVAYKSFTGSVSVFLETAMACNDKGSIAVTLSLRNSASYILSLVKISEVTENVELFQVKYMEGLLLFPGTDTRISVVIYTPPHDLQDPPIGIPSISLNCKLLIVTNDSRNPRIEIPCLDLVHSCSRLQFDSAFAAPGSPYVGLDFQEEKEESTRTGSLGSIIQEPSPIKWKVSDIAEADELILRNWRSQGTSSGMSVLEDDELLFPMVQVGTHCSEWISVTNPSGEPVVMQLVLNAGLIIDQCRTADELLQNPISSSFVCNNSVSTKDGFFLAETAITEAYVHPYGRAFLGPIVFHPSNRCMWQSSALIRNNLSGVEWLPLRGFGGSLSLVLLEGSEPVQHLEFNLEVPIPLNMSPTDLEGTSFACVQPLSKELFAKNTGDLPLEVRRIEVSGTICGLDGFMIQTCKGFALEPGESIRLLISYQTDFSAPVVHRDLELALATGMLVIPMKANLPVYMLSLCRKSFFWMLLMKLFLVASVVLVAAAVTFMLFYRILPQVMASRTHDYLCRSDRNAIATISRADKPSRAHRNQRNIRSLREEAEKPDMCFVTGYSDHPNGIQELKDTAQEMKKMQDQEAQISSPLECQKTSSPPASIAKSTPVSECAVIPESPQTGKLRVRIERERGRRRKRRAAGASAGLTGKLEVSSSQSGNSTPSSPLSPLTAFTPKRIWSLSPDVENSIEAPEHPFVGAAKQHPRKERVFESAAEAGLQEPDIAIKCYNNSSLFSGHEQPSTPIKPTSSRPVLLPSATFPVMGWRAPGFMGTSPFSGSSSAIAPPARAPGFKVVKEEPVKPKEKVGLQEEFTYDIWGNHFSEFHLMDKPNECSPKVSDASVGNSQSFFAMGPQSLKQMTRQRSLSPTSKLDSCFPTAHVANM